jgi:predicted MPP superfamily phosphohydrolase
MRSATSWWIIALIIFLLDLYVFQALKTVSQQGSDRGRQAIYVTYWLVSFFTIATMLSFPYLQFLQTSKIFRNYVFAILIGLFLAKLIGSLFFVADDIRRGALVLMNKIFPLSGAQYMGPEGQGIPRSTFLSWLGLGLGGTLFGTLLFGFGNKYNYQVKKIKLSFKNLPDAFKGMRMVHISDIHSGSFQDIRAVNKGIDLILKQQPDLIVFTGDLVNDRATEMEPYQNSFGRLTAPLGVFSTLGNHDYGDYVQWPTTQAKIDNLEALKKVHANMGWRLLMNEHVVLEKNGEKIALLGILPEYSSIDLMLSGHTHGMQFGLENPYFKWSPVQWMYKQWAGLYEQGSQKLYVNRGYGFIGYPGRVGILPEITVIELI